MGEYAPDDQRTIHRNAGPDQPTSKWHEHEEAQLEQSQSQPGYGNARNLDGTMEQDIATDTQEKASTDQSVQAQPGEISDRPDSRAAADADRPLGAS